MLEFRTAIPIAPRKIFTPFRLIVKIAQFALNCEDGGEVVSHPAQIAPYFTGIWVIIGIAGFLLFHRGNNVTFKRRWFPWYIVVIGMLFAGFALFTTVSVWKDGKAPSALVVSSIIALIGYLNIRITKFCGNCGRTVAPFGGLTPPKYCPKCGRPMD